MTAATAISAAMNHASRWSRTLVGCAGSELGRIEAGFLVDRLDDFGADARLHLLVDLDEGALPDRALLLGERQDLGLAGRLHLGERAFVVLEGVFVGELGGVGHC